MHRHRARHVVTLIHEARLPRAERNAARAERQVEEMMRDQRDWRDERAMQLAEVEAERRRVSPFSGKG